MISTKVRLFLALCIGIVIGMSIGSEDGILHPKPMHFGTPRFEGDSMVAGLSYDKATSTANRVYDWRSDFINADVNGNSGARLESVLLFSKPSQTPIIVLFAGFNNVKHLDETEDSVIAAYSKTFAELQQRSKAIYCVGIPPIVHAKSDSWYPEGATITNTRILNINSRIETLCGAGYIDTPSFWTEEDTDDGIHPNNQGYRKISGELKRQKLIVFWVWLSDLIVWGS